ncbi:DUF6805 domain-containing protein [Puia sp. P3]|uniref:DUF6805 domain-containing protein n=1 Tax=Puia sp. P3 TaxID=3423952 RepID=UPI003D668159
MAGGEEIVAVNGKPVKAVVGNDGYLAVDRVWKNKDEVEVSLPMRTMAEGLPDGSHWVAFLRGADRPCCANRYGRYGGVVGRQQQVGAYRTGKVDAAGSGADAGDRRSLHGEAAGRGSALFQIHESRYIMYWPYARKADIPKIEAALKKREQEKLRKEAATVDMVYPGEQQPESDHGWKGENTVTGFFRERHYRSAKGWFSYRLANAVGQGAAIGFTYYGTDGPKRFEVLVNGQSVARVELTAGGEKEFKDYEIGLPEGLKSATELTVVFRAADGSAVPGIYEVRLLRK